MNLKILHIEGAWEQELQHYKEDFDKESGSRNFVNSTIKSKNNKGFKNVPAYVKLMAKNSVRRQTRGFVDPVTMPTLDKIRELTGLKDCQIIIQKYAQGEVILWHVDYFPAHDLAEREDVSSYKPKYKKWKNLDNVRLILALEDRKKGHFIQIGDKIFNKWKKGDCFYYDSKKIFHSAGNSGPEPRYMLRITGKPTKKFQEFLKIKNHKV